MKTYNAKQVAEKLNMHNRSVRVRANRLGFTKRGRDWIFTEEQLEAIKKYVPAPKYHSLFYFSADGNYIILNSRMNQYERLTIKK